MLRADLTGLGISHLMPGGGATATTVCCRWLVAGGVSTEYATVSVAVGSMLTLALVDSRRSFRTGRCT
ncbi:membrane protein implicated in regulation of membrane protease activity [Kribbella aluminosa]|uniref:Membrane protein implicated in regulation of membrane protease activity n=1 Tax=Kribbella aluminosa TaxID=416017 RepID=A0ABS4ULS0_9ACTN|nr:hypothetical protein [Kribbella aluminosa]MBP2352588.1 membrane protein implicated in regulation of membrane protease activity [Kribbella aluminosa]